MSDFQCLENNKKKSADIRNFRFGKFDQWAYFLCQSKHFSPSSVKQNIELGGLKD